MGTGQSKEPEEEPVPDEIKNGGLEGLKYLQVNDLDINTKFNRRTLLYHSVSRMLHDESPSVTVDDIQLLIDKGATSEYPWICLLPFTNFSGGERLVDVLLEHASRSEALFEFIDLTSSYTKVNTELLCSILERTLVDLEVSSNHLRFLSQKCFMSTQKTIPNMQCIISLLLKHCGAEVVFSGRCKSGNLFECLIHSYLHRAQDLEYEVFCFTKDITGTHWDRPPVGSIVGTLQRIQDLDPRVYVPDSLLEALLGSSHREWFKNLRQSRVYNLLSEASMTPMLDHLNKYIDCALQMN